jgi:hypothetical protein
MEKINILVTNLYSEQPTKTLFHYTSLSGLQGIVKHNYLWAGDIRYLNDAAELKFTADLINSEIIRRLYKSNGNNKLLNQLKYWINHRMNAGHIIFVISFTENGNQLSQWRGYCPHGKGVSIGFNPDYLKACAVRQSFKIGKCIYDGKKQKEYISLIIDQIEILAQENGEAPPSKKHPSHSYELIFELVEDYLLQIGALIKHPKFDEEQEWRLVSPIIKNYVHAPIRYREGSSMLLPYLEFSLKECGGLKIEHIYLGPSQNFGLSINSLGRFLAKEGLNPPIGYCQIPYREK